MRVEYGYNLRNRTKRTKTVEFNADSTVTKIVKTKLVYPNRTLDASIYKKVQIKGYTANRIIVSHTVEENISSVWGYQNFRGIYKNYVEHGKVKVDTVYIKHEGW